MFIGCENARGGRTDSRLAREIALRVREIKKRVVFERGRERERDAEIDAKNIQARSRELIYMRLLYTFVRGYREDFAADYIPPASVCYSKSRQVSLSRETVKRPRSKKTLRRERTRRENERGRINVYKIFATDEDTIDGGKRRR